MKITDAPDRVCFDTNVVLDVLLDRVPFAQSATQLLEAVIHKHIQGLIVATTVTTVDFLVRRHSSADAAKRSVSELLSLFEIAAVDRKVIDLALQLNWSDFEDAVLHEAACMTNATAIVTRNTSDFKAAHLHVYTPEELLAILQTRGV